MDATATYEELRSFWQTAYASLDPEPGSRQGARLQAMLEQWASGVLAADGVSATSPIRKLFSLKPPEPFFGSWRCTNGGFSVAGKTIIALINPGDGIGFAHCADPDISLVGRPHWALLKEFYTNGSVYHDGSAHALLYKRDLMNPNYGYRHGTRTFGWGWWSGQWANMLRAMGETRSEEECFLTIELFAYSSPSAGRLSADVLSVLRSSGLVVRLLAELVQQPQETAPRRIVLVNKRAVWPNKWAT